MPHTFHSFNKLVEEFREKLKYQTRQKASFRVKTTHNIMRVSERIKETNVYLARASYGMGFMDTNISSKLWHSTVSSLSVEVVCFSYRLDKSAGHLIMACVMPTASRRDK